MKWAVSSTTPPEREGIPSPTVSPREFVERMADHIAKTTITMGGNVSSAYKAAAMFAEACEALWEPDSSSGPAKP